MDFDVVEFPETLDRLNPAVELAFERRTSLGLASQAAVLNAAGNPEDRLADSDRCDGCKTVSPSARAHRIPGLGWGCVDCVDLAISPYRPSSWGRRPPWWDLWPPP